jgi:hypothetical protein
LPIELPSMVEAENFSDHPRIYIYIYIYMQHSRISEIAVAMSRMKPSAVVTFLLSAVLLVLCEYGHGLQLAIIYNSELLKYCVDMTFIVTSMLVVFFAISYLLLVYLTTLTKVYIR